MSAMSQTNGNPTGLFIVRLIQNRLWLGNGLEVFRAPRGSLCAYESDQIEATARYTERVDDHRVRYQIFVRSSTRDLTE